MMEDKIIQTIWNNANKFERQYYSGKTQCTRDYKTLSKYNWNELYEIEKIQLTKIIKNTNHCIFKDICNKSTKLWCKYFEILKESNCECLIFLNIIKISSIYIEDNK